MVRSLNYKPELVHPTVFIAPGARIIGNVWLEENASVWFNAVIRGDTEEIRVGRRSNVQDGCVLHADPGFPCLLGEGVTVAHSAIIHGAIIEDDVMIGMRAVVMNGARIGAGSIVGVGAVVTARTQIPPRSLVFGVPAKVRRPLQPEEFGVMKHTANHYVEEARLFVEQYREKQGDA